MRRGRQLAAYGITVSKQHQSSYNASVSNYQELLLAGMDPKLCSPGRYYEGYGYYRLNTSLQEVVWEVYERAGRRFRPKRWLWSERRLRRVLADVHRLVDAEQGYDGATFMRALVYRAKLRDAVRFHLAEPPERSVADCLRLATITNVSQDIMLGVILINASTDMILDAAANNYLNLLHELV